MVTTWIKRLVLGLLSAIVLVALAWQFLWRPVPMVAYEIEPTDLTVETMGTGTLEDVASRAAEWFTDAFERSAAEPR